MRERERERERERKRKEEREEGELVDVFEKESKEGVDGVARKRLRICRQIK